MKCDNFDKEFKKLHLRLDIMAVLLILLCSLWGYVQYSEYQKNLAFKQELFDILDKEAAQQKDYYEKMHQIIQGIHNDLTHN